MDISFIFEKYNLQGGMMLQVFDGGKGSGHA